MEEKSSYLSWILIVLNYVFVTHATEIRIDTMPADIELSAAKVFINREHTIKFTIHATSQDDDLAEDLINPHFAIEVAYCMSGNGGGNPVPDSCNIGAQTKVDAITDTENTAKLHQEFKIGNFYAISGHANLEVTDEDDCALIQHVCIIISGSKTGGVNNDIACIPTQVVCQDDWVDIAASDFRLEETLVNSNSYTDIRARVGITISNEGTLGNYEVTMFLSTDNDINPHTDKEITGLPLSFSKLSDLPAASTVVDISGEGLKIPDVHSNIADQKYCGWVYIGLMVDGIRSTDPVRDRGAVLEPDEWNNFDVYRIMIICPGDSFSVSDFSYTLGYKQDVIVGTFTYPVWVNLTIHLHHHDRSPIYPISANFDMDLYLHDYSTTFIDKDTGTINSTAIKISTPGIVYPDGYSSRVGRATGESVHLENVELTVEIIDPMVDAFSPETVKLFVFVKEPSDSSFVETVKANNFQGAPVDVEKKGIYVDVNWVKQDQVLWPEALQHNDPMSQTTFKGFVKSGLSGKANLYWSVDDKFDESDSDSGLIFELVPTGLENEVRLASPVPPFAAPTTQPQFCGRIYGIWFHEPQTDLTFDALVHNDIYIRRIVIRCEPGGGDIFALTQLQVLNPPVMWEGVPTDFRFTVTISCVFDGCQSSGLKTEVNQQLQVFIDGQSPTTITQTAYDYGDYDNRTLVATYDVQLSGATNRFVAEIIAGGDSFTANHRLVYDLPPIIPLPFDTMDINTVSMTISDSSIELDSEIAFSVSATLDFANNLPVSDWPHFHFDLYVSTDTVFSDDDFKISYRTTDALRDALSEELSASFTYTDHVGFRLPREGLERFCPSKSVYICTYMDTYDPDEDDEIDGQIQEVIEYNNFGCIATTKLLDTANIIDCSTKQVDPQAQLGVTVLEGVSLQAGTASVVAVFKDVVMKFKFDVGITNHHSVQLNSNDSLPGNWDLEFELPGPIPLNLITDLTALKERMIGPGETLRFPVEVETDGTENFCTEYVPDGIDFTVRLVLKGGEDVLDYATPTDYTTKLTLACTNAFGPSFTFIRPFDINVDASATSSFEIPLEVSLTNYYEGSSNFILNANAPYYTLDATLTTVGQACPDTTLSPITFEVGLTDQLGIELGATRTFRIKAQLDVDAALCTCMAAASANTLKLTVEPKVIAPGYEDSHYESDLPGTININCGVATLVDLTLSTTGSISSDLIMSPALQYPGMTVTVSPTNNYILQFIFSFDEIIDPGDEILEEFSLAAGGTFNGVTQQVPLDSYKAGRYCGTTDMYLIIHVELDAGVSDPDRNLLDNTIYKQISFTCPGDIYRLVSVENLDTSLVGDDPGVENRLRFKATVFTTNTDDTAFTPGNRHLPKITFEIEHKDKTDLGPLGSDGFWWSWTELRVLNRQELPNNDPLQNYQLIEYTLDGAETITADQCNNIITPTGKMRIHMYEGIALGADIQDIVPQDDFIETDAACSSSFWDLELTSLTIDPSNIFDLTLTSRPPGATGGANLRLYLSLDDLLDPEVDTFIHEATLTLPGDLTQTDITMSQFDNNLVFKYCGYVHYIAVIEPAAALNDPDWSNNMNSTLEEIDCETILSDNVKDLYTIEDVDIEAQSTFMSDRPALFTFGAQIRNVGTATISSADNILLFKVKVKRGVNFLMDKMIDITPEWRYSGDEEDKLTEAHAVDELKTFSRIEGNITIPLAVCEMGVDHLFIGVEKSDNIHNESVLQNNYEAFPISCIVTDSSIDLYPRPDQAGGYRFRLMEKYGIILGEPQQFILEVVRNVTGDGGGAWNPLPHDGSPVFRYEFILHPPDTSDLPPVTVPHPSNVTEINQDLMTNQSTIFILGGYLTFPVSLFMDFCGLTDLTLEVRIDADDDVMETDEYNNKASILGLELGELTPTCDATLSTLAISDLILLPAGRAYALAGTTLTHRLHLQFTLIYKTRTANSPPDPVDIDLLLRGTREVSGTAGDRKSLSGLSWRSVTTGTGSSTYTANIVIGPSEAKADDYTIKSSMSDVDLSVYCGRIPYFRILVDPDGARPEDYQHARVAWTKIRLECEDEDGFALTAMTAEPQILSLNSPTQTFTATVSNKGSHIQNIQNVKLFFNVYLRTPTTSVRISGNTQEFYVATHGTWFSGDLRTYNLGPYSLNMLDSCDHFEDLEEICIQVEHTTEGSPPFDDNNQNDNIRCTPIIPGLLDVDCARDIAVLTPRFTLLAPSIITKDVPVDLDFNLTLNHRGRSIPSTPDTEGHFDFDFYIRTDATCAPASDVMISSPEDTTLEIKVMSDLQNNTEYFISGRTQARVPADSCIDGELHYVCVKYNFRTTLTPTFRDHDILNDCACYNMSAHFVCRDLDDIEPVSFSLRNRVVELNQDLNFHLEVRVDKVDPNISAPFYFEGRFLLSSDGRADSGDVPVVYDFFDYGVSKGEMLRHLTAGNHTMNLGGKHLVIPETAINSPNLCGEVNLLYQADPNNRILEKSEGNNVRSTSVIISCDGNLPALPGVRDLLHLKNFQFDIREPLFAGRDSHIYIDYDVVNVGPDIALPSLTSDVYEVELSSNMGHTLLMNTSRLELPRSFKQPMANGRRHTYIGIKGTVGSSVLTSVLCQGTTQLELCVKRAGDNVPNHCLSLTLDGDKKSCRLIDHGRDIEALTFSAPTFFELQSNITIHMEMSVNLAPKAIPIHSFDFRSAIYLSHSPHVAPYMTYSPVRLDEEVPVIEGHKIVDLYNDIEILPGERKWKRETFEDQISDVTDEYCGLQYMHLVVDAGRDLLESSETNNILTKQVTIQCTQDVWSVGPVTLETSEEMLIENTSLPFTMRLPVSCVDPACHLDSASENIILSVSYGHVNETFPVVSGFNIEHGYDGRVSPGLGVSFPSPSIVRDFTIRGDITLPIGLCDAGMVRVIVEVHPGADAPDLTESVTVNNRYSIHYPCSAGLRGDPMLRDILAYPIGILGGKRFGNDVGLSGPAKNRAVLKTGGRNVFRLRIEIRGPSITPQDGLPPTAPFSYALYISKEETLDGLDTKLPYVMSDGVATKLSNLPPDPSYVIDIQDFNNGFRVPPGFCGPWYIIIHLDDTDRIEEASETNNMAATQVFVNCPSNVFKMTELSLDLQQPIWPNEDYNCTATVHIANVALFSVHTSTDPVGSFSAYLSEDPILDIAINPGDPSDKEIYTNNTDDDLARRLKVSILPGEELNVTLSLSNITVSQAECGLLQFIIVDFQPARKYKETDTFRSDNYMAYPILTACSGVADIIASGFTASGQLSGAASWSTLSSRPDSYTYRVWASHNNFLEPEIDAQLNIEGRHVIGGFSDVPETVLSNVNLTILPTEFCGEVYLIAELDVYDEIVEEDETNNVIAASVFKSCPDDILSFNILHVTPTGVLYCEESITLTIGFYVNCFNNDTSLCTNIPATSGNNFYFTLKLLDDNLQHVTNVVPGQLDESTISNSGAVQQVLVRNPMQFAITEDFDLENRTQCEDIRYLEVEIHPGTSPVMVGVALGPRESKVRRAPVRFISEPQEIDFAVSAVRGGTEFNQVNVSSRVFDLVLEVLVIAENWDVDYTNMAPFTYVLGVESTAHPEWNIVDLGYMPSSAIHEKLTGKLTSGLIDLSEQTTYINWDLLKTFCGQQGLMLTVRLDPDNRVVEDDETNNFLGSGDRFNVIECKNGMDLKISHYSLGKNDLRAGDSVDVDIDVSFVLVGPNIGLFERTEGKKNYIIEFHLVDSRDNPSVVHAIEYDMTGLEELSAMVWTTNTDPLTSGVSDIVEHKLDGMMPVNIPPDTVLCGNSWFLRVCVHLETQTVGVVEIDKSQDLSPGDNCAYEEVRIQCKDDWLSLWDVTLVEKPEEIWADANYEVKYKITVRNSGNAIPPSPGTHYLFGVKQYFSPFSDSTTGYVSDVVIARRDGEEDPYRHTTGLAENSLYESPVLTGEFRITLAQCDQAVGNSGNPTLRLELSLGPADENYSPVPENDILKISLKDCKFLCREANVDLLVNSLLVSEGTGEIIANSPANILFNLQHTRTLFGAIPASTSDDLSYNYTLKCSSNDVLDDGDRVIPIQYNARERVLMKNGIGPTTPGVIAFSPQILLNTTADPLSTHCCGKSYLFIILRDLKNIENIDPHLENNYLGTPIHLHCPGDVVSLKNVQVTLTGNQRQLYPSIWTEIDFKGEIEYYSHLIQPGSTWRKPLINFRFFLSKDTLLEVYIDPEMQAYPEISHTSTGFTPGMEPQIYEGLVQLLADPSACKCEPNYLLVLAMFGGNWDQQDPILLNNYQAIPLNGLLNCSLDTADLSIRGFDLMSGYVLTPGMPVTFNATVRSYLTRNAFLGSILTDSTGQTPRIYDMAFMLSVDDKADDNDSILPYDFSEFDKYLRTLLFYTLFDIPMIPSTNLLMIPEDVDPSLCGQAHLILKVDPENKISETDERNNVASIKVNLRCPCDVLSMKVTKFLPQQSYFTRPGVMTIGIEIAAFGGDSFTYDGDAMRITVCIRANVDSICHDITPETPWLDVKDDSPISFADPLLPGQNVTYPDIMNYIDLENACSSGKEPIVTGENEIVFTLLVGDTIRKAGQYDGISNNNRRIEKVTVDCTHNFLDLSIKDFHLSTPSGYSTKAITLGMNYFQLLAYLNTSDSMVYNQHIDGDKVFDFKFEVFGFLDRILGYGDDGTPDIASEVKIVSLPYTSSRSKINRQVSTNDVLDLSDLTYGLNLEDFLWTCLAKSVSVLVKLDSQDQLLETDERNNRKSAVSLQKPPCLEGKDLVVKEWRIFGLSFDMLRAEMDVSFTLRVETLLVGNTSSIDGLPDFIRRHHFQIWFFLSKDRERFLNESDVVIGLTLSEFQIKALKADYRDLDLMVLDGKMNIPINSTTYPLCWQNVNVGVMIDPENKFEEVDKENNLAYYEVIFDCGNDVDECSRKIAKCHKHATCKDRPYSHFDYHQGPLENGTGPDDRPRYVCKCKKGFTGDGYDCTNIDECSEVDENGTPLHNCHTIQNSKCVDRQGGYDCMCDDGFKLKSDFISGVSKCEDIDECKQRMGTDCHHEAICTNTQGSYNCTCRPGYIGNGTICKDVNECKNNPCLNGGSCHNARNHAWCTCPCFYEGEFCEKVNGNWGSWGAWSTCYPPCGDHSYRLRHRSCDNPRPNGGRYCSVYSRNGGRKQIEHCYRAPCGVKNIETCEQSRCKVTDTCGNLHQNLICEPGYKKIQRGDGSEVCVDIDECDSNDKRTQHSCDLVLGICTNVAGSYRCSCFKGYTKMNKTGNKCHDKRECMDGTHRCDKNAECCETPGGYDCVCKSGYKKEKLGDPITGTCIEERLLPFGKASGDKLVVTKSTLVPNEVTSGLIRIPHCLPLPNGKCAPAVYISENGVIVATREVIDSSHKNPYQRAELFDQAELFESRTEALIAPFWSDASFSNNTEIWYQMYNEREEIHEKIEELAALEDVCPDMDMDFVLKVTWHKMKPPYSSRDQENTFQAVLFTDNVHSCVLFIYDKEGMGWKPLIGFDLPVVEIGYFTLSQNISLLYTNTSQPSYEDIYMYGQSPNDTGVRELRLDNTPPTYRSPKRGCLKWYRDQPRVEPWVKELAQQCPSFLRQAQKDKRFAETSLTDVKCFSRQYPYLSDAILRCCYEKSGALPRTTAFAPRKENFLKHGFVILSKTDHEAFDLCCNEAPDGSFDYCNMFLEKRPLSSSEKYDQLLTAGIDAMGIYTTFDGHINVLPTFGEYLACRSSCLLLQTRHSLDKKKEEPVHVRAIAIKVVCISPSKIEIYSTNTTLEVWVDNIKWTVDMKFEGFSIQPIDDCHNAGVVIIFDNGIVLQVTSRKLRLRAILMVPRSVIEGDKFEGLLGNGDGDRTNDDKPFKPKDDPQSIGCSIQSWELMQVYGRSTYGESVRDLSLFSKYTSLYVTSDVTINGPLDYLKRNQLLPDLNVDNTDLYANRAVCTFDDAPDPYIPCLLDILKTDDQLLGRKTLDDRGCFLNLISDLSYVPPTFVDPPEKLVLTRRSKELGLPLHEMDIIYTVTARHTGDGDLVFTPSLKDRRHFEILESIEQIRRIKVERASSGDGFTATFTYSLNITLDPIYLSITVSDGNAAAVWQPHVIMCLCQNGGSCVTDIAEIKDDHGLWSNARCTCPPGWTGVECDVELNGCYMKPCKTDCIDWPAPGRYDINFKEFSCKSCPVDQEGDGRTCYALNECLLEEGHSSRHQCQHICTDTPDKYVCSCHPGFKLVNGTKCEDLSECISQNLNDCDPTHGTCEDKPPGSYTCGCQDGFHLVKDNKCEDIDECIGTHTCQQVCQNKDGSYECSCLYGYTKDLQDRCIDIDECATGDHGCDGECKNTNGGYYCDCPRTGFSLHDDLCRCKPDSEFECSEEENICQDSKAFCSKINGTTSCHCPKGFYLSVDKLSCVDLDECTTKRHLCSLSADCINYPGTYNCKCKEGFISDGAAEVCKDFDECKAGKHQCQQRCVNVQGSFFCTCNNGYTLDKDGVSCYDTKECDPGQYNECAPEARCDPLPDGRYKCTCQEGFAGDGLDCYDLRSCDENNGGCQMKCEDTIGSHVCSCYEGYAQDPDDLTKCVAIDMCTAPEVDSKCSQFCHSDNKLHPQKDGLYRCSCKTGYVLRSDGRTCQAVTNGCEHVCGGGTCKDERCVCYRGYIQTGSSATSECININECSFGIHRCNSTLKAFCEDMTPGYQCVCQQGYRLNLDRISCSEIDECATETHDCNRKTSYCRNLDGSYECECKQGFTKNDHNPKICDDINECKSRDSQVAPCATYEKADCLNLPGSYACRCKEGYYGNGTNCYDKDECRDQDICDKEREVCVNEEGGYHCECRQGYQNESGICQNIDECSSPLLNDCEPRAMCEDKPGYFICHCEQDEIPHEDGRRCIRRNECTEREKSKCGNAQCKVVKDILNTGGERPGFTAVCDCCYPWTFKVGTGMECVDVNECEENNPCKKNAQCVNTAPLFSCRCVDPYILSPDGLTCEETDGRYGPYSEFSPCSKDCGGVKTRTRVCDSPKPVGWNRTCKGKAIDKELCSRRDKEFCQVISPAQGSFMDIFGMDPPDFEEIERIITKSEAQALNAYLKKNNITEEKYCRKNKGYVKGRTLQVSGENLKSSGIYPRSSPPSNQTGTRFMRYVDLSIQCRGTQGSSRSKRSVPYIIEQPRYEHHDEYVRNILTDSKDTDFLPPKVYQAAMTDVDANNESILMSYFNENLYDARKMEEVGKMDFAFTTAYNEDFETTTTRVVVTAAPEILPAWGIAMIAVVGCIILIILITLLIIKLINKKQKHNHSKGDVE